MSTQDIESPWLVDVRIPGTTTTRPTPIRRRLEKSEIISNTGSSTNDVTHFEVTTVMYTDSVSRIVVIISASAILHAHMHSHVLAGIHASPSIIPSSIF